MNFPKYPRPAPKISALDVRLKSYNSAVNTVIQHDLYQTDRMENPAAQLSADENRFVEAAHRLFYAGDAADEAIPKTDDGLMAAKRAALFARLIHGAVTPGGERPIFSAPESYTPDAAADAQVAYLNEHREDFAARNKAATLLIETNQAHFDILGEHASLALSVGQAALASLEQNRMERLPLPSATNFEAEWAAFNEAEE